MDTAITEIVQLLRDAAAKLGTTVEALWPEVVRAMYGERIAAFAVSLILLGASAVFVRLFWSACRKDDWEREEMITGLVVALLLLVGSGVPTIINMVSLARFLTSPVGAAALTLLGK